MNNFARIIVAVAFLVGLGVAANAEIQSDVVVTLPFAFVAGGKTLPAGTYAVKHLSEQPFDTLILSNYEDRTSVFVRPIEMEEATAYKPRVQFHKVGQQNFLSTIQTADYVFNFSVPRSAILD